MEWYINAKWIQPINWLKTSAQNNNEKKYVTKLLKCNKNEHCNVLETGNI